MRNGLCRTVLALGFTVGVSQTAQAAEETRVASSFEDDDVFDIHFGVAYDYKFKRASILREWNSGRPDDNENRLVKDLIYRQQRHTLTPTMEIGLWHDLAIYMALPVILADTREYSFDQSADDCVFGDGVPPAPEATCVNKNNSTTVRDEIIPSNGIDATQGASAFTQFTGAGTELIFRGPVRRGLDQFHVGIKYGILNQAKRSHMPNWIVAAEGRFAVGRAMSFSRDFDSNPDGNGRVGRRIHELGLWTALSRRYRFLDPFFTAFWRQSVRASNSKFQDFSSEGSQSVVNPQSTAGLGVGTEIVPWERKAKNLKVAIMLGGTATLHYGGRGYSEIWELLADSPALVGSYRPTSQATDGNGNSTDAGFCDRGLALDHARANPGDPGYAQTGGGSCQRFEGVTDLQDFATFGFQGGLNFHLGQYTRIQLGVKANTDTRHFITAAGRGDAARAGGGADPDKVEVGTVEVNPIRRDVVDNVGRRYVVDDVLDFHGYLRLMMTF